MAWALYMFHYSSEKGDKTVTERAFSHSQRAPITRSASTDGSEKKSYTRGNGALLPVAVVVFDLPRACLVGILCTF